MMRWLGTLKRDEWTVCVCGCRIVQVNGVLHSGGDVNTCEFSVFRVQLKHVSRDDLC